MRNASPCQRPAVATAKRAPSGSVPRRRRGSAAGFGFRRILLGEQVRADVRRKSDTFNGERGSCGAEGDAFRGVPRRRRGSAAGFGFCRILLGEQFRRAERGGGSERPARKTESSRPSPPTPSRAASSCSVAAQSSIWLSGCVWSPRCASASQTRSKERPWPRTCAGVPAAPVSTSALPSRSSSAVVPAANRRCNRSIRTSRYTRGRSRSDAAAASERPSPRHS